MPLHKKMEPLWVKIPTLELITVSKNQKQQFGATYIYKKGFFFFKTPRPNNQAPEASVQSLSQWATLQGFMLETHNFKPSHDQE